MKASDTVELSPRLRRPVRLTRLGFGAASIANLYRRVEEEDAQAALQAAYDGGIRYFDTAPQYGLGLSEQRLGHALRRLGREGVAVSTKVGRLLEDCAPEDVSRTSFVDTPQKRIVYDYGYDGIMRSHEASLKRLGVEAVDILYVHDVDAFTHGSVDARDQRVREIFDRGGFRALDELRASGQVKAIGAGVNEWQVCERLLDMGDFDAFLIAGRYTLLEQEPLETFLPRCVERDVGIVLGSPYNSGILAQGAVPGARYNYEPAPPEILARVGSIEAVCRDHGVRLVEAALHFPLAHPAVRAVLPGAASVAEVQTNLALLAKTPPAALWADLKGAGLIRRDAPTPED